MGADATCGEEGEAAVGEALLGELLGVWDAEAREGVVLQVAVLAEEVLHPLGLRAGVRCRHVRRFGRLLATRDLQMPDCRSEIHSSRAETSITALYRVRKLGSSFPGR